MSARRRLAGLAVPVAGAAAALALCLYDLGTRPLWLDESATVSITSQHGAALLAAMRHDGGNMLAYYAFIHVLIGWFGDGEWVIRLPSAIGAGLAAGVVAVLGTRLFDRRVGLASGMLFAISLPIVYWGQDARAYVLMVLFVSLSFLAFVVLVDDRGRQRPAWATWLTALGYAASLVLAAYMSFVVVLVVPAQLLALVWYRRRVREVVVALVLTGVACLPIVVLAHERGAGQLFWVGKPNRHTLLPILELLGSSGLGTAFQSTSTGTPLLVLTGLLLVAVAVVALRHARAHPVSGGISEQRFAGVLVAGWLVVPIVLMTLESLVGQSIYESRYALISIPAVAIGLAWGALRTGLPAAVAWASLAVLALLRLAQIWPTYGVPTENWTQVTSHVLVRARPGDCIAFYPADNRMPFDYYVKHRPAGTTTAVVPRPVLPSAPFSEVKPYVEDYTMPPVATVRHYPEECPVLWLVSSHAGSATGPASSRQHLDDFRTLLRALKAEYPEHTWFAAHPGLAIGVWRFSVSPSAN